VSAQGAALHAVCAQVPTWRMHMAARLLVSSSVHVSHRYHSLQQPKQQQQQAALHADLDLCSTAAAHTRLKSTVGKESRRPHFACMDWNTLPGRCAAVNKHTVPCHTHLVARCCWRRNTLQRIRQATDCGLCHVCRCCQA
jgi:hypothetical protein